MAPIVPFIPLIAAGVGAAGSIIGAKIGANATKNSAGSGMIPPAASPLIDGEEKGPKKPIMYGTGPLGDTTSPTLQRGKLLGN